MIVTHKGFCSVEKFILKYYIGEVVNVGKKTKQNKTDMFSKICS